MRTIQLRIPRCRGIHSEMLLHDIDPRAALIQRRAAHFFLPNIAKEAGQLSCFPANQATARDALLAYARGTHLLHDLANLIKWILTSVRTQSRVSG